MFGNKKEEKTGKVMSTSSGSTAASGAINSLVQGTKVEGKINAGSDIRIDGELKGSLKCKGRVIIGQSGKIEGDIDCQNAIIEGSFNGNIKVAETLTVKETARIEGEVNTNKLLVQPGAVFNVSCNMGGQKLKSFAEKVEKSSEPALSFSKK
ncbi:MAG: polymer-forming cytoskeletal protein [Saprospiraceae bacterium]|nr:polymer-forming cytoskeletal protein [Saprospiraceae bacterium]